MSDQVNPDDLEKEIIFMEQELIFKTKLLSECREKLKTEVIEHAKTKSIANKYKNENSELHIQLEVFLAGAQKLEEEDKKNRESMVKLQVQLDAYITERQQLLDSCYQKEQENSNLKTELSELKEQLRGHLMLLENLNQKRTKIETLVTEIISKQKTLNQEQSRLDAACKEGIRFAEILSEEAKFQAKFVQEAQIGQMKMENEIIRLMAALQQLKAELEKNRSEKVSSENQNYIELWKSQQKEMKIRNEELQEINQKLLEELNFTKEQVETLLKNYS